MPKYRVDLNVARSMVGRHANLHLKDGSVIVNVCIMEAKRGTPSVLCYKSPTKRELTQIPLREVDWLEPIDAHLFILI